MQITIQYQIIFQYNQMNRQPKQQVGVKGRSARRSQRRISKLLDKNISQYQIENPYKNSRLHSFLPKNLSRQLSKMEYFSVRSLQNLKFNQPNAQQEVNELLLSMRFAVQRQSEEFGLFVAQEIKRTKKHSINTNCQSEPNNEEEIQIEQLSNSDLAEKQSDKSISINNENEYEGNLPLLQHNSEDVSLMSDRYEVDKLNFYQNHQILNHIEQPIQLFYV